MKTGSRGVWLVVPSRLQLRVIRAFKSTLEDLEERRSCHSLQSLRNSRCQLGNRSQLYDDDSKSPQSSRQCELCCSSGNVRLVTPVEDTTAETAPLMPSPLSSKEPPADHHNNKSTMKCTCRHYPLPYATNLGFIHTPSHFSSLLSQTLHTNMAQHSSSLEPPSNSSSIHFLSDIHSLIHETSI